MFGLIVSLLLRRSPYGNGRATSTINTKLRLSTWSRYSRSGTVGRKEVVGGTPTSSSRDGFTRVSEREYLIQVRFDRTEPKSELKVLFRNQHSLTLAAEKFQCPVIFSRSFSDDGSAEIGYPDISESLQT